MNNEISNAECGYCGENHATDYICDKMFTQHAIGVMKSQPKQAEPPDYFKPVSEPISVTANVVIGGQIEPIEPKAEPPEYEPLCWKCGDRGFVLAPLGISAAGTTECSECKGRNRKRRKEFHEPKADTPVCPKCGHKPHGEVCEQFSNGCRCYQPLEVAARAFAVQEFPYGAGHLLVGDIGKLFEKFARQQEPRIRREAIAEVVRQVEAYADQFGDGTQQGFVRDALEAGQKEMEL